MRSATIMIGNRKDLASAYLPGSNEISAFALLPELFTSSQTVFISIPAINISSAPATQHKSSAVQPFTSSLS